ncbi:MAG: hypothetical protein R2849_11410 [Thermomicrobiales bacterium]
MVGMGSPGRIRATMWSSRCRASVAGASMVCTAERSGASRWLGISIEGRVGRETSGIFGIPSDALRSKARWVAWSRLRRTRSSPHRRIGSLGPAILFTFKELARRWQAEVEVRHVDLKLIDIHVFKVVRFLDRIGVQWFRFGFDARDWLWIFNGRFIDRRRVRSGSFLAGLGGRLLLRLTRGCCNVDRRRFEVG